MVYRFYLSFLTDGSKRYNCTILDLHDRSVIASICWHCCKWHVSSTTFLFCHFVYYFCFFYSILFTHLYSSIYKSIIFLLQSYNVNSIYHLIIFCLSCNLPELSYFQTTPPFSFLSLFALHILFYTILYFQK